MARRPRCACAAADDVCSIQRGERDGGHAFLNRCDAERAPSGDARQFAAHYQNMVRAALQRALTTVISEMSFDEDALPPRQICYLMALFATRVHGYVHFHVCCHHAYRYHGVRVIFTSAAPEYEKSPHGDGEQRYMRVDA